MSWMRSKSTRESSSMRKPGIARSFFAKIVRRPSSAPSSRPSTPSFTPVFNEHNHVELRYLDAQAEHPARDILKAFLIRHSHLDLTGKVYGISDAPKGHRGYSDIYTGFYKPTEHSESKVAVKKLRVNILEDGKFQKRLAKELYIWSILNHPRVLPFTGFFIEDSSYPALVSEWMENGTALKYLEMNPNTDLLLMTLGIAEGVDYLHKNGIVHFDIKPDNVLISSSGEPLLCDFGVSRMLAASRTFQFSSSLTGGVRGTIRFMSKELLDGSDQVQEGHSKESDVWAFGMTVLSLLTKEPPYSQIKNDIQVLTTITRGSVPPSPDGLKSWSVQNQILWHICTFCWLNNHARLLMPIITSGLDIMQHDIGLVPRSPTQENEAYNYALKLLEQHSAQLQLDINIDVKSPGSLHLSGLSETTMKDLSQSDPSGNFLRIDFESDTNIVRLAMLGEYESPCMDPVTKTPVYFASVAFSMRSHSFADSLQPGSFTPGLEMPLRTPYGGEEYQFDYRTSSSVLPFKKEVMGLVPTSDGLFPPGRRPTIDGKEGDGKKLYHAVAVVDGVKVIGKCAGHLGGASVGLRGRERNDYDDYEILCWKD